MHIAIRPIDLVDLLLADGADAGSQADACVHAIGILFAVLADVAAGALAGSIGKVMGRVGNHHKIFGGGIHACVHQLRRVSALLGKGRAGGQAGQQGLTRRCGQAAGDRRAHAQGQGAAVYGDGGAIDNHIARQGQDAAIHIDALGADCVRQLAIAHGHVAGGDGNRSSGDRQQRAAIQVEGHAVGDGSGAGHGIILGQQGDGAVLGIGGLDGLGQGGMIGGDAACAQAGHNASAALAHAIGIRGMLMGEDVKGLIRNVKGIAVGCCILNDPLRSVHIGEERIAGGQQVGQAVAGLGGIDAMEHAAGEADGAALDNQAIGILDSIGIAEHAVRDVQAAAGDENAVALAAGGTGRIRAGYLAAADNGDIAAGDVQDILSDAET